MKVLVQQRQNIETENHQIVVLKPFNKNFTIYKKVIIIFFLKMSLIS